MKDTNKTKAQLIDELVELRKKVSEPPHADSHGRQPGLRHHETEARLGAFMDGATDGFVMFDADLNLIEINRASLGLFPEGTTREDLLGKNITRLQPNLEKTDRYQGYLNTLRTAEPLVAEDVVPGGQFGDKHLLVRAFKVGGGLGLIHTDISQLRQANERTEHLNRVLRAIRDVNQLIVSEKDRDALIQRACEILIETRGYQHAWIALTDDSGVASSTAEAGRGEAFASLKERMAAGDLPVCWRRALEIGEVVVVDDPASFCGDCPLTVTHDGSTSGVTVRLEHGGRLFGALGLAVRTSHGKDPEEISLVQELAGDLGLALHGLQAERERERSFRELAKSEEKYRVMLTNLEEGFYTATVDGTLLVHNIAFNKILGFDPTENLAGKQLPDFWQDPADRKPYLEEMTRNGYIKGHMINARKRNGEQIIIQATSRFVKDESGRPVRIEGTFLDITNRVQAENAQRRSEELLAVTLKSIGDAVISTDRDGCVAFMNPTAEATTGWSLAEATGRPLDDVFDIRNEDTGSKVESPVKRVLREGVVVELANHSKLIRRDGTELPIADSGAPIRDQGGEIIGAVLVFQDIAERKKSEAALRESEHRLRESQKMAHLGNWLWDVKTGEVEWSDEVFDIFRLDPRTFTPQIDSIMALSPWPENNKRDKELIQQAIETHEVGSYEQRILRPDGSTGHCFSIFQGIYGDDDKLTGIRGTVQDITERKRAEEALGRSEAFLNSIIEQSPYSTWISDATGTMVRMNQACRDLLKISDDEVVNKYSVLQDNIVREQGQMALVRSVFEDGETVHFQLEYESAGLDNLNLRTPSFHILEVNISPIKDASGTVTNAVVQHLDVTERERAERELLESERRFRLVAESLSDVVYEWDLGMCIEWFGDVDALMGHDPGGFPRTLDGWASLIHPDDLEQVMAAVDRQLKHAAPYTVEYRVRRKDDNYSTWSARGAVLRDAEGQPQKWIGAITDITERRKAEGDLSLKNQVFEDSIAALSIADSNGIITDVNPAFLTLWGHGSKEDAIGGTVSEFFVDEADAGPVLEALGASGRWEGDFLARRADGTQFISHGRATAMKNERGELIGYQSANLDVTEQTRTEDEIKLRNRIASIFLSVPDDEMYTEVLKVVLDVAQSEFGVFGYIDEDGALVVPSMTRHIWDQCQVPEKDIVFPRDRWGDSIWPQAIGRKELLFSNSPSNLTPKGHVPVSRNITAPIVHQGEVVGLLQVANKTSDYTQADIRNVETLRDMVAPILSARLARDQQERDRRRREEDIVALNKDLDERVVARTIELTAANKELEAFAYSVSHDLRAPLRGIDGFSKALLDDYQDKLDDTGKDYINRVRAGTQRMGRLIDDMLKLSRLTRSEMHQQRLDLGELAQKIAAELQRDKPERRVDFEVSPGLTAHGDRALLGAALENLLGNAWKFTGHREHATIELGVTEHAGERVFFVRDNGAGFDMAYVDKLFGPFQRLHDTAEFPGSGIGLAIVQRVILRHGGRIWADGEIDKGATFYFTLPTKTANAGEGADS